MLIIGSNYIVKLGKVGDIEKIFSSEHFDNSLQNSRLWFLSEVPITIIENVELFGYGADIENVRKEIPENNPNTGRKIIVYSAF